MTIHYIRFCKSSIISRYRYHTVSRCVTTTSTIVIHHSELTCFDFGCAFCCIYKDLHIAQIDYVISWSCLHLLNHWSIQKSEDLIRKYWFLYFTLLFSCIISLTNWSVDDPVRKENVTLHWDRAHSGRQSPLWHLHGIHHRPHPWPASENNSWQLHKWTHSGACRPLCADVVNRYRMSKSFATSI